MGRCARTERKTVEYRKAELPDLGTVFTISQAAIRAIYPYFYPQAAVDWFAEHHSCEHILADITAGRVRLLEANGMPVGTGTIDGNRLLRVFVAPEHQQKGYGTRLLAQLEKVVGRVHPTAILDSSLPAGRFYQNRGYRTRSHEFFDIEDKYGLLLATLAWEVMEKPLREQAAPAVAAAGANPTGQPAASEPAPEEAAPAPQPAKAPSQAPAVPEGAPSTTTTVQISAASADVMKHLPQMPF